MLPLIKGKMEESELLGWRKAK